MPLTLNEDSLIEKLVPDPSQVPGLKMRIGWLGKSSRRKYWRLYLTPELNSYLEFREEDIVHTLSMASDMNPLGGTTVFLKREAELLHTRTTSTQAQAEWLGGDIMRRHLRRTGISGLLAPGGGFVGIFPTVFVTTTIIIVVVITLVVCDGDGDGGDGGGPTFTLSPNTVCEGGGGPGSC